MLFLDCWMGDAKVFMVWETPGLGLENLLAELIPDSTMVVFLLAKLIFDHVGGKFANPTNTRLRVRTRI